MLDHDQTRLKASRTGGCSAYFGNFFHRSMFATLLLPNFRLQAVLRFAPASRKMEAVALVQSGESRGPDVLLEVSDLAAQKGIHAGMSAAKAFARCPTLQLLAACRESENNAQKTLLQTAWSLSPKVEIFQPGICTADLRGSLRKPETLVLGALSQLELLGLDAKGGLAPGPDLALLAAHHGAPLRCVQNGAAFAATLPLRALTSDPALLGTLSQWGIHTAGALLKLPRQQALERLGPEGQALWEAARGGKARPLRCAQEPVLFEEFLAFEAEIETLEPLLFILNRFLEALLCRLKSTARLASGMHLELPLENGCVHRRFFTVPAPTLEAAVLLGILKTHLEQLKLEHRPVAVRLRLEVTSQKHCALDLFEPVLRDPNRFGETLARLGALLGEDRIGIPLPASSHFSEPVRLENASALYRTQPVSAFQPSRLCRGLPLHRFRPAPGGRVNFSNSQPSYICSEKISGRIIKSCGPYRLSGQWWDADPTIKEEWDVQVSLHRHGQSGTVLARIATTPCAALETTSDSENCFLEGIYNISLH
jgi:protein ImuB